MIHLSLISASTCCRKRFSVLNKIPEHIRSDSSTEEENATHEQKTNHQLRRRIRHLEHDLRDITTHFSVERERRMKLEAVIDGVICTPV
jgi:low affinity Fe/Cu permease